MGRLLILTLVIQLWLTGCSSGATTSSTPAPQAEVDQIRDAVLANMKENFSGPSWFRHAEGASLAMGAKDATTAVKTALFPKDSNQEVAKSICRGFITGTMSKIWDRMLQVRAEGGTSIMRCAAEIAGGALKTPITFN